MEWSPQQEGAIRAARQWLKDGHQQVFRIFGYAGTGKTTLAREIASHANGNVLYGAFTGKAASVMRRKGCEDASTIHSMIYKLDDRDPENPRFILDKDSAVRDAGLVIIDECSMVGEEIGNDLLSFKKKILVLGDPAQLPPISGAGFFTEQTPDIMLTEVHRQAQDNPIIALSMRVRMGENLEIGTYGDSQIIKRDDLDQTNVLDADQVIVGLNRTRHLYNARIRSLLGHKLSVPVRKDKLICLKNDRMKGIHNGGLWEVKNVKHDKKGKPIFHMLLTSLDEADRKVGVQVREEFFDGNEGKLEWQDKKGTQEFTYGYAITCHKSQGSQWNNIMIFDEGAAFREDAIRWRYTALTRAAEKVTWVI